MKPRLVWMATLLAAAVCHAQDTPPAPLEINAKDYPNLQAALDAVPKSGGIVRLLPGKFEITQPLVIDTEDTRLEGAGASTVIVNKNEEGKPALHLRPDGYSADPKARVWRIQLGNFRVMGNEKSGDGVLAEGVNEIFIHGLSVDHHGGNGINLLQCYEDPRVADSILTYNKKVGLNLEGCHDIVVNGNHFEENQDALRCADGFNLTANGNNLDDHLRHGIVIENTYGSVVSGNMIEECQGLALLLDRDCYGITLSANVIAHDFEGGIDLRDAWGCAISANTFTLVHKFGIRVGPESGRLTITGNNFCNSYAGGGKQIRPAEAPTKEGIDAGNGVLLEDTEDIVISGNLFSGMDGEAIVTKGNCERISMTGNLITDINRRAAAKAPEASKPAP